jgi:parallel beta-helix repeat protein
VKQGKEVYRRISFSLVLITVFLSVTYVTVKVPRVKASGTIFIRADGSIEPLTANISSDDNVTYTFTGNMNDGIVTERNDTILDGDGYTLQGSGDGVGLDLTSVHNITIGNLTIKNFQHGMRLEASSNINIHGNTITNNSYSVFLTYSFTSIPFPSNYNTVSSNTITNNSYGIHLSMFSSNNTVSGNTITGNYYYGVQLDSSSHYNTISGNTLANNGLGVHSDSSSFNIVSGNTIANNSLGIYFTYSSCNNTISGNTITGNYNYGIQLACSGPNTVSGNSFVDDGLFVYGSLGNIVADNLVNGKPMVYLEEASDVVVEDAGQVILINCNRIQVENLSLSNTDVGVQLWYTNDTKITGNTLTNNSYGLFLASFSNYNTISSNTIANNSNGVFLQLSTNNTVTGNAITNNVNVGVTLSLWCNYSTISANTITDSWYGVQLTYGSNNNVISGNNITYNNRGVHLFSHSNCNIISANTIANNSCGIMIEASGNNEFYHNYIANINQTFVESGFANTWDDGYPSGGNCWSDYEDKYLNATEIDESGLWDSPYVIDECNQDNYPIIPELPTFVTLPLFMTSSLVAAYAYRRRCARE